MLEWGSEFANLSGGIPPCPPAVCKCLNGETACEGAIKDPKQKNFHLTRSWCLLVYGSRDTAGPVPSADSVFFSGPASQFSAVDDCLGLGFAVYAKNDL